MPNEPNILGRYDSGHAIIPVYHPSEGETHYIAVSEGTPAMDFHDALLDAGYHGPTREGALELSPEFRQAAAKALERSGYGRRPQEAGFVVDRSGNITQELQGQEFEQGADKGGMHVKADSGIFAIVHTHPLPTIYKQWNQQPSAVDIATAKQARTNIYVVSSTGLWQVEPSGDVTHVFNCFDWMSKNPK